MYIVLSVYYSRDAVSCCHFTIRVQPAPGILYYQLKFAHTNSQCKLSPEDNLPINHRMSLSQVSLGCQAATPGNFNHFRFLPRELQLMVFEEFLQATQKPRIVLLDVEECQLFSWDSHLLGWQLKVENREQLHAENPAVVARSLLGVSRRSRYVATRFLDRLDDMIDPPIHSDALMGLGLSLACDFFWLPDDLPRFVATRGNPPALLGPTDEEEVDFIMISLHAFEEALRWAMGRWEDYERVDGAAQWLRFVLGDVLDYYPASWNLVIIVDVPRGHISWDQIEIVGAHDIAIFGMGGDDGPDRCCSAFRNYETLHDDILRTCALQQDLNDDDGDVPSERQGSGRAWPELSFAFLRSELHPRSSSWIYSDS